jgi:hypothetical protein
VAETMSTESVDTPVMETKEEWLMEEEWYVPEEWVVPEKTSTKTHTISPPQCYIRIHFSIPNFHFGTTRRWYVVDVIKIFLLVLKSQFN